MKNPFSLEAFADWCEKQPADKSYDYADLHNCACMQYARFLGDTRRFSEIPAFCSSAYGSHGIGYYAVLLPWTFGALAQRLREAAS